MESVPATFDDALRTLSDNFNILADEVQLLSDSKTILEHKLRFAHERFQSLADRFAPTDPEIWDTIAQLQLPPDSTLPSDPGFVPLPKKRQDLSKHQTAVAIRDGRQASRKIADLRGWAQPAEDISSSCSRTSLNGTRTSDRQTSQSTLLEQDFTIPGKRSKLLCPFAAMEDGAAQSEVPPLEESATLRSKCSLSPSVGHVTAGQDSTDPICAMILEEHNQAPPSTVGSAPRCPIRFLDQHSPEDVARYVETHKHEIPRSHEICVKRYQRNEQDLRKLDAKYGNLVSMITKLGEKHQPMFPAHVYDEQVFEEDATSNERVENWAKDVSADRGAEEPHVVADVHSDRESRFDRPLQEIRVGESPSRPWGIAVPDAEDHISLPSQPIQSELDTDGEALRKAATTPTSPRREQRPPGKCPFGHGATSQPAPPLVTLDEPEANHQAAASAHLPPTLAESVPGIQPTPMTSPGDVPKEKFPSHEVSGSRYGPQVVISGPIIIGYPMEQAAAFVKELQAALSQPGASASG